MYNSGRDGWAKEFLARRPDVTMATIEKIPAQPVSRPARLCAQRLARLRAVLPDADAGAAGDTPAHAVPDSGRRRIVGTECRGDGLPLEGAAGTEGSDHQPGARVPEAASAVDGGALKPARRTKKSPPKRGLQRLQRGCVADQCSVGGVVTSTSGWVTCALLALAPGSSRSAGSPARACPPAARLCSAWRGASTTVAVGSRSALALPQQRPGFLQQGQSHCLC